MSSPAGTTIRGIQVMEDRGVRGAIIGAIQVTTESAEHLKPKSDSQTKEDWIKSIYISVGLDYVTQV